ncbi:MAG: YHS domain-containing (seleno)protein [Gammaproteobacteria bacterium]
MSGIIRFWLAPVLLLVGGVFLSAVVDSDDAVDLPFNFYDPAGSGVGASGYDVVAYFDRQEAVEGTPDMVVSFGGKNWFFSTLANRDKFDNDPRRYIPQYGGHCAYAAGNNYLAPGDPEAWTVKNGKLYLNYNKSVRNGWLANWEGYITSGDKNWLSLATQKYK